MLAISTPGLYLTPGGNAPPGTPADPVLGLVIDETAGYTVMAVMILEQPGRVVKVSGAGKHSGLPARLFCDGGLMQVEVTFALR
jgi:hypothetical protein